MQHSADQHEVALPSKNTQSWLVGSIREASMDRSTSFELDWRNGLGLALSVLVAFISGPGGGAWLPQHSCDGWRCGTYIPSALQQISQDVRNFTHMYQPSHSYSYPG